MSTPQTMSGVDFAALRGVSPAMVSKYRKAGRLVLDADGNILVAASIARLDQTGDPSRGGKPEAPEAEISGYQTSRAKREHYEALKAELAYKRDAGELLVASEVAGIVAAALTTLRTALEAIPERAAAALPVPSEAQQQAKAALQDVIERALADLETSFTQLGKP